MTRPSKADVDAAALAARRAFAIAAMAGEVPEGCMSAAVFGALGRPESARAELPGDEATRLAARTRLAIDAAGRALLAAKEGGRDAYWRAFAAVILGHKADATAAPAPQKETP